jgi:hypothetical protein
VVDALARLDRFVSRPLAALGDHVLYRLERTHAPVSSFTSATGVRETA